MAKRIVIEADSIEEARKLVLSQIPMGFSFISETVIEDGTPKTIEAIGLSIDNELKKAIAKVPPNAKIIEQTVCRPPSSQIAVVDAFDELTAKTAARKQYSGHKEIVRLKVTGYKWLFGIIKKPNTYEVEFLSNGYGVVCYKLKAKIEIKFDTEENVVNLVDSIIKDANKLVEPFIGPDGERYPGPRKDAAIKLGKIGHHHAVDTLIEWLADFDEEVRINAALAIGNIGSSQAVDVLLELALKDDDRFLYANYSHYGHLALRCAAVSALEQIGGENAKKALLHVPSEMFAAVRQWKQKRTFDPHILRELGYTFWRQ